MLKKKINKAAYDELDDGIKSLYKQKGDDYFLDVEGSNDDDVDALRRARDREAQEAKELRTRLRDAEQKLQDLGGDDARKRADVEALDKSWKEKYEKRERELLEGSTKKDELIKRMMAEDRAEALANKISNAPTLMKRVIRDRLHVDMDGDQPTLKVLDKDGKPSALTVEDLEKEIVADKEFATIIIGSKASGGGAGTGDLPGKSSASPNSGQQTDFAKMSPQEHAAYLKQQKEQSQH